MKFISTSATFPTALVCIVSLLQLSIAGSTIANWLYTGELDANTTRLLDRPDISGVQTLYNWKSLEPQQDQYNFSAISRDLDLVKSKGKELWVQLQDRSFSLEISPVPKYLRQPVYNNGSVRQYADSTSSGPDGNGWVTAQWNPHVRGRFQLLLKALAAHFDGRIYGINFPETSIAIKWEESNTTCQEYFNASMDNALFARSVFNTSYVVQYDNFWCLINGSNPQATAYAFYANHSIGVGGPDNIPHKPYQMENSYKFLHKYSDNVPISVIAVQEPDLRQINPKTNRTFTKEEFTDFAANYLGSKIIFWSLSSPWLM